MRQSDRLHRWDAALAVYLSSRRALGRRYDTDERILRSLRAHLSRRRLSDLDATSFERWRRRFAHCSHNTQLDYALVVYKFCRYRNRRNPGCFLPDRNALGRHRPYPLPSPIDGEQVTRLLDFLASLHRPSERRLSRPALRLAIVLMHTAGLRCGEVARLRLDDVEADTGVLHIRISKFHKSRWVPLSVDATRELRKYLRARTAAEPHPTSTAPLLCSCIGHPYSSAGLGVAVKRVMVRSGIWANAARIARVHDFRHGFAVAALRRWYEADADVQSQLPKLALYMGHVSIASTAHYLRYMPAIVALAGQRFARACDGLIDGGAS